ncbi:MAG TPA: YbhB/YbcL family Raf kinase inhibitor-like protein [Solirubrobacteraceae bacterium]|jgi:hypothetical protein|nr:YbhB/YbcL family Raf kinase inhibitor-like protein [Solirubrobacteraceae bacterium]
MKGNPYEGLPAVPSFQLQSSLIADGETLPVAQRSGSFGAGGSDTSPDLAWSAFSEETRSFIVTMYDPDAPTPSGLWHWAVTNIPAGVTSLPVGAGDSDETLPAGARHLRNDDGLRRYLGAAPRPGEPPHRYYVCITALKTLTAGVSDTTSPAMALFETVPNTIGRAMLVPVYGA